MVTELIVPFGTTANISYGLILFTLIVIVGLYYSFQFKFNKKSIFGYTLDFLRKSYIVCATSMLLILLIRVPFALTGNDPAVILNQEGVWIQHFGLIPWKNINEFDTYKYMDLPLDMIGIRVKNLALLSKQASLAGKCEIFWSKLIGYPHIKLANLALKNDQVISFAKQFIG